MDTCTFCGAYKTKRFRVKPIEEIFADIRQQVRTPQDTRRVFLMDGDALVVNNAKLVPVLQQLQASFPKLTRIASYANGPNLTNRDPAALEELYRHKLRLIYMGLESGAQSVLDLCQKGSSVQQMVQAVRKAAEARIKSSVIVLLGLGGREHFSEHVRGTIQALNAMQPRYLSFLSLMVIPGTPLAHDVARGKRAELGPQELLIELRQILEGLELTGTIFRSNHASNYLPLAGVLPKDKFALLERIDKAVQGRVPLTPEAWRGL
jgi:radical SAM superfamily enzyme YgiQ (UPF0313 family)